MNELILPWPSADLSPNARNGHWAQRKRAAQNARTLAFYETKKAGWPSINLPDGDLFLWVDFYPPTKRRPDDDNMLARFKAYRDGIADALAINDSRFVSRPYVKSESRKGGEVRVRITGGPTP